MKLLKVLVAAAVMAAMVTPAIAEDRLKLNGEMRVRGWHIDNDTDYTDTFADQRLRIGGTLSVAEGVSVTFRTDITESNWGSGNVYGSGRIGVQQWDRAHIDLTMGNAHLRVGQQFAGLGKTFALDAQSNGVAFNYKSSVPFSAFVLLVDDNTTNAGADYIIDQDETSPTYGDIIQNPVDSSTGSDAFLYGAKVSPKFGDVATDFYIGGWNDGADEDVMLFGADMTAAFGGVNLVGELDVFTGDADATTDAMGTQVYLDGSMAATDTVTVGLQAFYASAAGDNEEQYVLIGNDFNGYDPIMDVGTSLSNEVIEFDRPFDFTGDDAGVTAGRLYAKFKLAEGVNAGASIAYLEPEDDKMTTVDDATAFAAGITYDLMANTSLQAQFQYTDISDSVDDEELTQIGTGLFVKF